MGNVTVMFKSEQERCSKSIGPVVQRYEHSVCMVIRKAEGARVQIPSGPPFIIKKDRK